ncbi:hypothetical protein LAZ67_5003813 [Cordylochernes scorpioides]|uniref:Histone-lysine N-methyltransferase SETMAR n=1 Tax=Cordylochernes scorpioides TaxID=51811 RepID=A0ABY6KHH4_9ARAC|nr:hypothetical protein LAZ67_5003813 [Cordylochernes scorpioides]
MSSVRYWFNDFERGRTSVFDEDHPTDLITEEILEKVHDIILSDRGMKVGEVTAAIEAIGSIGISIAPGEQQADVFEQFNCDHRCDLDSFLYLGNQTTIKPMGFFRRICSNEGQDGSICQKSYDGDFWGGGVRRLLFSSPTKKKGVGRDRTRVTPGCKENSQTRKKHVNKLRKRHFLIVQIKVADDLRHQLLLVTRSGNAFFLKEKNVYYENAPAHSSGVVATKLKELRYEFVPNPLYSPILAPCDFYLFTHMKRWLAGEKFGFNEEIISCKKMYFVDLDNCLFGRAEKRQGR